MARIVGMTDSQAKTETEGAVTAPSAPEAAAAPGSERKPKGTGRKKAK